MAPRMPHRGSILYSIVVLTWLLVPERSLSSSLAGKSQSFTILEGAVGVRYEFVSFLKMSAMVYLCQSSLVLVGPTSIPLSTRILDFRVNAGPPMTLITGEFSKDTSLKKVLPYYSRCLTTGMV